MLAFIIVFIEKIWIVNEFVGFYLNMGVKILLTGVACELGLGEKSIEVLSSGECVRLSEIYLQHIREGSITPIHGAWKTLSFSGNTSVFETWRDFAHGGTHRVHLTPEGSVRMCPKLEETRFARFGAAESGGVERAWHSASLEELRKCNVTKDAIVGVPLSRLPPVRQGTMREV
ncbi:MAG: hypothetical protein U1E43_06775 [Rhodospirillales bacterium]